MADISEALATAVGHHRAGRLVEAEEIYRRILAVQPDNVSALHFLGMLSYELGKDAAAAKYSEKAVRLKPDHAEACYFLGLALRRQGRVNAAIECFRRTIELKPSFAEVHNNLGFTLAEQGLTEQSIACYRRAIELDPQLADAYFNLSNAYLDSGMHDEAVESARRAIEIKPEYAQAYHNLGRAAHDRRQLDEAVGWFRRALELEPRLGETHCSIGRVFKEQGRYEEAAQSFDRAIELMPQSAEARLSRAMLRLLKGDLASGWAEFEWRWKTGQLPIRAIQGREWQGEPLSGKTILLCAEQGLGDTLQFVRYAGVLKDSGATVVVECQRPLAKLLGGCPSIDKVVSKGDVLPAFDVYAPLLSLPRILKTSLDNVPAKAPYLFSDPELENHWRDKLRHIEGFRIGTNWRGRPGQGVFRGRDIPLECFASIAQVPGVRFVSLQKGEGREELAGINFPIFDPSEDVDTIQGAFMDSAAIMMNLDLVITSDTSVPHLAGALGVPVWLALPCVPDWRWLLDRSDSPWYPTMRLFRQERAGDWAAVFEEMRRALQELKRS